MFHISQARKCIRKQYGNKIMLKITYPESLDVETSNFAGELGQELSAHWKRLRTTPR